MGEIAVGIGWVYCLSQFIGWNLEFHCVSRISYIFVLFDCKAWTDHCSKRWSTVFVEFSSQTINQTISEIFIEMGGLFFTFCFFVSIGGIGGFSFVSSILLKLTLLLGFVSSSELFGVLIKSNFSLNILNHKLFVRSLKVLEVYTFL
jgi:hypothetical protein